MSIASTPRGYIERPRPSGLADVIDVILDKGMVIDAYVRVSLIGIEILTVDARIVIASVDTYLRFAEAVNRLDIARDDQAEGLPQLISSMTSGGAESKTKGAIEGVKDHLKGEDGNGGDKKGALQAVKEKLSGDDDGEDQENQREAKSSRSRARGSRSTRSRSGSSSGSSSSGSRSRSRKAG